MTARVPHARHAFVPSNERKASCVRCSLPEADPVHTQPGRPRDPETALEAVRERTPTVGPATPNAEDSYEGEVGPERRRMPVDRESLTTKAVINDATTGGRFEFYITAGMYEDGTLGEVFIRDAGKEGSTTQGLIDAYATMFSIGLQYGATLDMLARKFAHMRFPPYGPTGDPQIPYAASLIDYICRWLALKFGSEKLNADLARIAKEMHP